MRAAGRLLALAPLAVLVVAVAAAPATAVGRDGESGLEVSVDGVSFDPERLWSEWGAVSYAVSAPDGSRERYYSDSYGPRDSADGFLAFSVPTRTFPDGYCVTWAQVSGLRAQHARWNGDDPVCTTAQAGPSPRRRHRHRPRRPRDLGPDGRGAARRGGRGGTRRDAGRAGARRHGGADRGADGGPDDGRSRRADADRRAHDRGPRAGAGPARLLSTGRRRPRPRARPSRPSPRWVSAGSSPPRPAA